MPAYEKKYADSCGDRVHFRRHYIYDGCRYVSLACGHCVFPRLKSRADSSTCSHWTTCADAQASAAKP